jgi:hypothetical protein
MLKIVSHTSILPSIRPSIKQWHWRSEKGKKQEWHWGMCICLEGVRNKSSSNKIGELGEAQH